MNFCTWVATGSVALFLPTLAHAASPTVAECLAASDSANKLDTELKLRAEHKQLLICAADTCPDEIRLECSKRAEQIGEAIPSVVFEVKDAIGADLSAVRITMNGELISERLNGDLLRIDPGEHTFTFEVAGQAPVHKTMILRVSEQNRRETVTFSELNRPPAVTPGTGSVISAPPPTAIQEKQALSTQRVAALVTGGVGAAGIVVGGVFGLIAASKKSDAEEICPGEKTCPTQPGVDAWHSAGKAGNVSTIAFIVGGIGLAGAATLWFTDPSGKRDRPYVITKKLAKIFGWGRRGHARSNPRHRLESGRGPAATRLA